jgi:hypothetical protein
MWPPRPVGEVFPELLDTLLVAQLLLYDRRGMTPEQARRNVRKLVKEARLPTLGRIGSTLMYRKDAVIGWLADRGAEETALTSSSADDTIGSAMTSIPNKTG